MTPVVSIKLKGAFPIDQKILIHNLQTFGAQENFILIIKKWEGGVVDMRFTQKLSADPHRIKFVANNARDSGHFRIHFYADATSDSDYNLKEIQMISMSLVVRLESMLRHIGVDFETVSRTE
jgi:hypothetical protein